MSLPPLVSKEHLLPVETLFYTIRILFLLIELLTNGFLCGR